ncbi:hypothetical protein [Actinokineospora sp. 24-640]
MALFAALGTAKPTSDSVVPPLAPVPVPQALNASASRAAPIVLFRT